MTQESLDTSAHLSSLLHRFFSVLIFQGGYNTSLVVVGTLFLGAMAGLIGTFALFRKRALVGDVLAHSTLPGIGIAFLISAWWGATERSTLVLLLGAFLSGMAALTVIQWVTARSRLSEDAILGSTLSVFFGAGVLVLSIIQSLGVGGEGGLNHFIFGQTASIRYYDALFMIIAMAIALGVVVALFKEFSLACFDRPYLKAIGWSDTYIDIVMMSLLIFVTLMGLQVVGLLLVIALLVIPPTSARFWSDRLSHIALISAFIGSVSGYLGASLSAVLPHSPAGAVIVLTSGACFFLSFLFGTRRGFIRAYAKFLSLRIFYTRDHFLRRGYETLERGNTVFFSGEKGFFGSLGRLIARVQGEIVSHRKGFELTEKGISRAAQLVRNHRLWETYLVEYSGCLPSHVDVSADLVEHVLSPQVVRELEESLRIRGHAIGGVLGSIHGD
jgi:manganese/zinc/iron transport system permease protein